MQNLLHNVDLSVIKAVLSMHCIINLIKVLNKDMGTKTPIFRNFSENVSQYYFAMSFNGKDVTNYCKKKHLSVTNDCSLPVLN